MSEAEASTAAATLERIRGALDGLSFEEVETRGGEACLAVEREALHDVLARLRDRAGFDMPTFVTAVDHHPKEPRLEVNHQLQASAHGDRVRVKTRLASGVAHLASAVDLWPGVSFMERECYDMFGIVFDGHPDLRRLLMPEGYGHHPLRKDFPHQGIEPDRLYREWDRKRREGWSAEG